MSSVNKVIIVGNLGRDPEMKYMPSGDAVTSIAVATTDSWKDKTSGEKKEVTEWHRVVAFGKLAEIMGQYPKKGSQVYIEGKLRTRKYTDKEGVERFTTEIIADTMQMLGSRPGGEQQESRPQQRQPQQQSRPAQNSRPPAQRPAPNFADMDDDIPF